MARLSATAIAAVLVLGLLAGCGGSSPASSSAPVTATAYVTALCQAVGPFEKDVATRSGALSATKSTTLAAGKAELVSYLGALSDASASAAARLRAAGLPDVAGGPAFARAIVTTFTRVHTALSRSHGLAAKLSTTSAAAYSSGAAALSSAVKSSLGRLGSGLSTHSNKALNEAAAKVAACHTL